MDVIIRNYLVRNLYCMYVEVEIICFFMLENFVLVIDSYSFFTYINIWFNGFDGINNGVKLVVYIRLYSFRGRLNKLLI